MSILSRFRASRGRFRGATGETSRTAPESGRRRYCVVVGRQPTPVRHRRAPGRLGQPRGPRAVPRRPRTGAVGVVACVALGRRRAAVNGPPLRHRRDACGVAPRLRGCQAAMGASCFASGAALDRGAGGGASWPRCDVLPAPLRFRGHRCGSLDSIALAAAQGAVLFQSARCSATFRFSRFMLKVDQRTPHGPHRCALSLKRAAVAWRSVAHTTWLALLQP